MDLAQIMEGVQGKKILFLGKTRTMSEEDIELFLDQVGASRAVDENDEPIALIVQGRLINPVEEAYCDEKYKTGIPVIELEKLEKYYASSIDRDALLGSLKLFANRERIIDLLHNRAIGDELFCEILKLYDWEGKGPFESDENRDVAGSLVARFYPDIERNHNIQYSPVGPFLVAAQSDNRELLEAMAQIPDYEITQRSQDVWMPRTLHESLLINPNLPKGLLDRFYNGGDLRKRGFVARHPNLPETKQKELMQSSACWVHEGLARNPNLSKELYEAFLKAGNDVVRNAFLQSQPIGWEAIVTQLEGADEKRLQAIGGNLHMDEVTALKLIETGDENLLAALAANESLAQSVYEALEKREKLSVLRRLAGNPSVDPKMLERLTRIRDKGVYTALAANPSTPQSHLKNFSKIRDKEIMMALASNPSTPIEILLGYQTNADLANILKRNEAFGEYIKQNLGM
ncbi:hypothetical protein HCR_15780 [Hydrogenimonas cancrithermarum]|uniref:Leucine rich repeat variant n=2 Tax=Hydrogenimonas cancrithermarum TaxID=2993563 RepID=A0ABN6WW13_9BACT|nr:hypothetical protein HCR_15780 [Hydrogenimonas cancrithermarum]